jgi:hypothetical protein
MTCEKFEIQLEEFNAFLTNKFDNLKSSLFLLKPVKNILVNQIRKQFDPFTLMREPATDEN